MQIYDISRELISAPRYPGFEAPQLIPQMRYGENGSHYNLSKLAIGAHEATHCDACWHYDNNGPDIAEMPLEHYVGPCYVMEVPEHSEITEEFIKTHLPNDVTRLLIKGGGDSYLSNEAAEYLYQHGVITMGTDGWSASPVKPGSRIHAIFLARGVAIIEMLDLSCVEAGYYTLSAAPVKVARCDAAPCRALLFRE